MSLLFRSAYTATVNADLARASASDASAAAGAALHKVEALSADVERLLMITEALWLIIKENNLVDDEVLLARIREIDLRDGRLDGRVARQGNPECPHCGRTLIGRHPMCLYCGRPADRDPFAR